MAKQQFKRMCSGLVPVGEDDVAAFAKIPLGAIITINLPNPKGLSTDVDDELQRRAAQNALMWGWLADLERTKANGIAGATRWEWHRFFRREYLLPIYTVSSEMWALTTANLDVIKQKGTWKMYERAWSMILDAEGPNRLSTADATVKQFSEYLGCIERFAHSKGAVLRTDPAMYRLAFEGC